MDIDPDILKPLTKTRKENIDLESLSKDDLIARVKSLEIHVQQLRNVIAKKDQSALPSARVRQKERKFDFTKYKRRHILLQVSYFGWDYCGFATQEEAGRTIESELFAALLQTKLVGDRSGANYHRCGRTDRGVSGTGQVVSLDVRTNLLQGDGVFTPDDYTGSGAGGKENEIDFCTVLNRNLPEDIRVTAWAPAPSLQFSARFDCEARSYKYYFPRAHLSIEAMRAGGQRLVGTHDFRNLCKMDVNNGVVTFVRRIDSVTVEVADRVQDGEDNPYDICCLIIRSKAFLWHQIRCIMAVLLMVGEGLESEEVVTTLLDVESNPCRPAYQMASDLALNLHSAEYEKIRWVRDDSSTEFVIKSTQKLWAEHAIRAAMVRGKLRELEENSGLAVHGQMECLTGRRKEKTYTRLMDLPKCPSLEEKIKTVVKKRKLEVGNSNEFDDSVSVPNECD